MKALKRIGLQEDSECLTARGLLGEQRYLQVRVSWFSTGPAKSACSFGWGSISTKSWVPALLTGPALGLVCEPLMAGAPTSGCPQSLW